MLFGAHLMNFQAGNRKEICKFVIHRAEAAKIISDSFFQLFFVVSAKVLGGKTYPVYSKLNLHTVHKTASMAHGEFAVCPLCVEQALDGHHSPES